MCAGQDALSRGLLASEGGREARPGWRSVATASLEALSPRPCPARAKARSLGLDTSPDSGPAPLARRLTGWGGLSAEPRLSRPPQAHGPTVLPVVQG